MEEEWFVPPTPALPGQEKPGGTAGGAGTEEESHRELLLHVHRSPAHTSQVPAVPYLHT